MQCRHRSVRQLIANVKSDSVTGGIDHATDISLSKLGADGNVDHGLATFVLDIHVGVLTGEQCKVVEKEQYDFTLVPVVQSSGTKKKIRLQK